MLLQILTAALILGNRVFVPPAHTSLLPIDALRFGTRYLSTAARRCPCTENSINTCALPARAGEQRVIPNSDYGPTGAGTESVPSTVSFIAGGDDHLHATAHDSFFSGIDVIGVLCAHLQRALRLERQLLQSPGFGVPN